jgi:hypothetical protein
MEKKKTGKYLKYALGEIVLVVIGILIALQINNWNQGRKQKIVEIQFLESIKQNLESDTIYFNQRIKDSDSLTKNHYQFVHQAYNEQKNATEFEKLINLLWWNSDQFEPQKSAYSEVLNSGQLNIFENEQLKDNLTELYNEYDIASNHIEEFNLFTANQLGEYDFNSMKYWTHYSYMFDEPYMFNDKEWRYINDTGSENFESIVSLAAAYSMKHKVFLDYFKDLKSKAHLMIDEIGQELEKRKKN